MSTRNKNLLRISELAKLSGVTLPTVKHYLNEGLIPKPVKTGKTMAYYDRSAVKRIIQIKKLQQEKFLPLDVIKRVIDFTPDNDEEMKLGEAIFRSDISEAAAPPVSEEYIEERTKYPLSKIKLFEREGIIKPIVRDDGKYYDATDLKIIELLRKREEAGFPFDYSLEMASIYYKAMERAIDNGIHLFVGSVLDDIPLQKAVELIAHHETSLDRYLFLVRRKINREFSEAAFRDFKVFSDNLQFLLFVPLRCNELPDKPPQGLRAKMIYYFFSGNYNSVMHLLEKEREKIKPLYAAASVFIDISRGDTKSALETTKQMIQCPSARSLDNMAAALAYIYAMRESSGVTESLFYAKKALAFLKRIEASRDNDVIADLFAKYFCGSIYTILPDIFNTHKCGIDILRGVEEVLHSDEIKSANLPEWLSRTIFYEVFPAVELRINRFFATCHLRYGNIRGAQSRLDKIIELAGPTGEFTEWARLQKLQIGRNHLSKNN